MSDDITDWTELHEFKAVALTASFVLSWHSQSDDLVLDLDLCLTPEHPLFEVPRRAGAACIRPALLEFPNCSRLTAGTRSAGGGAIADRASALAHGKISGLRRVGEGRYELHGEFGAVVIEAGRPLLRLGDRLV